MNRPTSSKSVNGARSHGRLLDVLTHVASDARGFSFSDIQRALGLPKSTLWVLLGDLEGREFVKKDAVTRQYRVGPALIALSLKATSKEHELSPIARPHLEKLTRDTGEDVYLGVLLDSKRIIYIDKVEGFHSVRLDIGIGIPRVIHRTAAGKVFLAFADRVASSPERGAPELSATALSEVPGLEAELEQVRVTGFAISDGASIEGVCALAAPVRTRDGEIIAAISVSGPAQRVRSSQKTIAKSLLTTVEQFGSALPPGLSTPALAQVPDVGRGAR